MYKKHPTKVKKSIERFQLLYITAKKKQFTINIR